MSTNTDSTDDALLETIPQVGQAREQKLVEAGIESASDLAEADPSDLVDSIDTLGPSHAETIVENARGLLDGTGATDETVGQAVPDPEIVDADEPEHVDADVPPEYQADDSANGGPETVDPDEFLDSTPEPSLDTPQECSNVLVIAGADAFDEGGPIGPIDDEQLAGIVEMRLNMFGFDPDAIGAMGAGMGRQAVNAWVAQTQANGDELPELVQFPVENYTDEGRPGSEEYRKRNNDALDWADGICVIANGEYIGIWVNMAMDTTDTLIETPEHNEG